MAEQPLVSVLMTAFNRERFVADAIKSVMQSTYKDFELIVVDDCSTDATAEIVRKYELSHSRIKLYVNQQNLGDYPNRNTAASYAQGKYLKYLDSDDLIYPHGLEVFVSSMERFPDAGLGVGCNGVQLREPFPICIRRPDVLRQHFFHTGILSTGPSGTIISKRAFDQIGGFSGKRMVGDTELWFSIACAYDVVIAPPSLIYWRQHDGQEFFHGVNSGLYAEMNFELVRALMEKEECTLSGEERFKVLEYYRKVTAKHLLKTMIKNGQVGRSLALSKNFDLKMSDYLYALLNIGKRINR